MSAGDNSGAYFPNLNVPSDEVILGIFHTHPYDATEYGYTNASLSDADGGYMINNNQKIIMAQSGEGQYVFLRTAATPVEVDYDQVDQEQNQMIATLMREQNFSFAKATQVAAQATAKKYDMAYYEGKNGVLDIVRH